MAKKKKANLRWDNNEMTWRDVNGNKVQHPRYMGRPSSLDSRRFRRAYLNCVREGESLNEFMKFHGKYDVKDVQAAARKMRKAYEDATEAAGQKDSFKLLRQRSKSKSTAVAMEIANLLISEGMRDPKDPRVAQLSEAD